MKNSEFSNYEFLNAEARTNSVSKGLNEAGTDQWLRVKREDNSQIIPIPKCIRIKDISLRSGREYFTIIDWPYAGVKASVKALPDNNSRFVDFNYNVGAVLLFDYATSKLSIQPGDITVNAGFDPNAPLPNGEYNIRLADHPHNLSDGYMHLSNYVRIWFFINDSDNIDRYIHAGTVSLGCLTVGVNGSDADIRRWTDIARILLKQRLSGNEGFLGKLKVKNYPEVFI